MKAEPQGRFDRLSFVFWQGLTYHPGVYNLEPLMTVSSEKKQLLSVGIHAHGAIAVGISAHGIVAIGVATHGIISIGVVSMGVLSMGLVSMGALSTGLVSMGILSYSQQTMSLRQSHHTPETMDMPPTEESSPMGEHGTMHP
jgi:hypothetical protein